MGCQVHNNYIISWVNDLLNLFLRMLEDFGQEVDLIGAEDGSSRSFLWTKLKYVPIGKPVYI